jgi:muramoyltetrapeptide carboxypeptidase
VIEIIPPFIKKGALFGLVSPAGKISAGALDPAEQFLSANGFRSIRSSHATDAFFQFSASDQYRLEDLQSMIDHPDIDVIWCTRGGYGAIRILEQIDFSAMKLRPKWLVGFSDVTVFHSALQNLYKVASVHGPMPKSIIGGEASEEQALHLLNLLQGHSVDYRTQPHPFNREGSAS